jgi:hypothetical protein
MIELSIGSTSLSPRGGVLNCCSRQKTEEASSRETRTPQARFINNWCGLWYVHVAVALVNQLGNNRPVLPSNAYTTAQHGAIELARKPAIFFMEYSKRVT